MKCFIITKKLFFFLFLFIFVILILFNKKNQPLKVKASSFDTFKTVYLKDNNIQCQIITGANSVEDFLKENKIKVTEDDLVYPTYSTKIVNGSKIIIQRGKRFQILTGNKIYQGKTQSETVKDLLEKIGINLKQEDIVIPKLDSFIYDGIKIKIIFVEIKEITIKKTIKYKTIIKKDDKLSWRMRKIKQKGKNGIKTITYKVIYHNNKEISRKQIKKEIMQKPQTEIIIQGDYIKLGKTHRGQASWYKFTGKMTAANPWLPLGSYVKVTNLDNNKSVIVKIVDRGPFGKGRIIDLEKNAFSKIASLGKGIINVKMEEIKN